MRVSRRLLRKPPTILAGSRNELPWIKVADEPAECVEKVHTFVLICFYRFLWYPSVVSLHLNKIPVVVFFFRVFGTSSSVHGRRRSVSSVLRLVKVNKSVAFIAGTLCPLVHLETLIST
jgi:hypothetical protein